MADHVIAWGSIGGVGLDIQSVSVVMGAGIDPSTLKKTGGFTFPMFFFVFVLFVSFFLLA